jgi:hypothetical protein
MTVRCFGRYEDLVRQENTRESGQARRVLIDVNSNDDRAEKYGRKNGMISHSLASRWFSLSFEQRQ